MGTPVPATEAPEVSRLVDARAAYFEGVRAWVRKDLGQAESAFLRCQQELAFAGSEEVADREARDAQLLLGKTEYFLDRIAERSGWETEAGGTEQVELARAGPAWEVRHGSIEPKMNRHVERWIQYFTGDGREVYQRWLDRKVLVQPTLDEAFARHGLPPELTYHGMIESGFSTRAYSWAHAVGIWQFVRPTARRYGLRSDWWVDERRDPVKSTDAASRYLVALYEEFGDWELALAAYNVGEGRVRQQIRRQKTRDFWQLRLPRETRNHLPKFYAALILGSDPEKYGFRIPSGSPPELEVVTVDFTVDFEVLGECAGVDPRILAELNPALVRNCTPPDEEGFQVLVPVGTGERTQLQLAALPEDERVRWARHTVRRGDTLSEIAEGYGTTVGAIASANQLRSRSFLSIGQELMIPRGQRSASPPRFASVQPYGPSSRKVVYTVRKGDTLSEIAERYGTSSRNLRRWNRVGKHIYPGQKLNVHTKGSSGSRSATSVKVRRGDTLWDIARHHGVSLSALLRANNLSKSSTIRPGDTIRIPRS